MISLIRAKMGTRGLNIFVWVAIFSMSGVFFMSDIFKIFKGSSDYALKINGVKLSHAEFDADVQQEKQKLTAMLQKYGPQAMQMMLAQNSGFSLDPVKNVIDMFYLRTLVSQVAKKTNLTISSAGAKKELRKRLSADFMDQASDKIDQKKLQEFTGKSVVELEKFVAQELQDALVLDLVAGSAFLGQFEIEQSYGDKHGQKQFAVITFPAKDLIAKIQAQKVSDHELSGFFKQQNDLTKRYWTIETRTAQVWELAQKDFAIKVSEQAISAFYHKNKKALYQDKPAEIKIRRISISKKEGQDLHDLYIKANSLRDKLVSGKDTFAQHNAKESTIVQSSEQAVGVERAAFALKTDGEISPAFELSGGIELIQRISRTPAKYKSLESLKDQIAKDLSKQKFQKLVELTLQRMANSASGVQQFKKLAEKKGLVSKTISGASNDTDPQIRGLFTIKAAGRVSYAITGEKVIITGLTTIDKAHVNKLDQIKATVLQDYQDDLVAKAMQAKLNQVRQACATAPGTSFESVAKQFGGELYTTKILTRSQVHEDTHLREKRLPSDVIWDLAQVDAVTSYITKGNEFLIGETGVKQADRAGYVIKLLALKLPAANEETAKQKAAIAKMLKNQRNYQWQQGFIASLGKNARIETNKTLLKATK